MSSSHEIFLNDQNVFNIFFYSTSISVMTTYLFFYGTSITILLLVISSKQGYINSSKQINTILFNEPLKKFCFVVVALSLLGVPPTWGFLLKLSILSTLLTNGHLFNLFLLFFFTLVGLFLYLQILKYSLNVVPSNKGLKNYLLTRKNSSLSLYYFMILFCFFLTFSIFFLRDFFLIF